MRCRALAAVVALVVPASASAQQVAGPGVVDSTTPLTCDDKELSFHRHRARAILKREYRVSYYSTHRVASKEKLDDYREHKLCIRHPGIRRELGKQRHDLAQFQRARIAATPYAGGGHWWAIPHYVVLCESGGDYTWPIGPLPFGGAYGMRDSWWLRGGSKYADVASNAEPWQQDPGRRPGLASRRQLGVRMSKDVALAVFNRLEQAGLMVSLKKRAAVEKGLVHDDYEVEVRLDSIKQPAQLRLIADQAERNDAKISAPYNEIALR